MRTRRPSLGSAWCIRLGERQQCGRGAAGLKDSERAVARPGGKDRLGGISKQGDRYLRGLATAAEVKPSVNTACVSTSETYQELSCSDATG